MIHSFVHIGLNDKEFYITLSGATTPDQSRPGSNGNEGVLCILQSSKTGTLSSDDLMSYPGFSLGVGAHPSAEMLSVYSAALADWTDKENRKLVLSNTIIGGARGVMVNGHGDTSPNPGWDWLHFT